MILATSTVALLALASFGAGMVDAIAGGGGLITLPALLAAGLPAPIALATNKGQSSFGAISSAVSFWRRDGVDRHRAPLGFLFAFAGSLAGARLLLAIRPEPLRPLVLVLLVIAAAIVLWPKRLVVSAVHRPAVAIAPIAFGLGIYDGFFGPGVGSMMIVACVMVFGDSLTRASGNAKIMNLASNLAALGLFAAKGAVDWSIALPMAAANAAGAFVGARVALARGDKLVRVVVVVVVTALVIKIAVDLARG